VTRIVVGTRNPKKKSEIESLLQGLPVQLLTIADFPAAPEVDEDEPTLDGNARKKALVLAEALNEWVVADDSGLEVDALGGRPGVHSARYAGSDATDSDRCAKLLAELKGVPDESRAARFRCVIALANAGGVLFTAEGRCEGRITAAMHGAGGFGYDPVFYYPPLGRTFAQLSPDEKNSVSHRGKALRAFRDKLGSYLKQGKAQMQKEYAIGIDLGGTFIKGGVIDLEGKVIHSTSIDTEADKGPDAVLSRIAELCHTVVKGAKIGWNQVKCVGVGTPGPLNRAKGMVYTAPNLPGWTNVPVVKVLQGKLNCAVALENDANAAAFAENWVGAGKGAESMILLTLGTGIGGGVVLEGNVWHGQDDAAGELGHMSINYEGPRCNCGSYGCIEAYASAPATVRRALAGIKEGRKTALKSVLEKNGEITAKDIYDAAVAGDALARETIETTGRLLGIAIANFVNIFNPQIVVLFGGLAGAGDMLFGPVTEEVKKRGLKPSADTVKILPARLGGNAGIIGAAGCALKTFETSA